MNTLPHPSTTALVGETLSQTAWPPCRSATAATTSAKCTMCIQHTCAASSLVGARTSAIGPCPGSATRMNRQTTTCAHTDHRLVENVYNRRPQKRQRLPTPSLRNYDRKFSAAHTPQNSPPTTSRPARTTGNTCWGFQAHERAPQLRKVPAIESPSALQNRP